jgi:hypothetical protein
VALAFLVGFSAGDLTGLARVARVVFCVVFFADAFCFALGLGFALDFDSGSVEKSDDNDDPFTLAASPFPLFPFTVFVAFVVFPFFPDSFAARPPLLALSL